MNRLVRRIAVWLGCFAVLLAALAPPISHLLAASQTLTVGQHHPLHDHDEHKLADEEPVPKHATSHSPTMHFEHCPFCLVHGGSYGLVPTAAISAMPAAVAFFAHPSLFYCSPEPLFTWNTACARAPPSLS